MNKAKERKKMQKQQMVYLSLKDIKPYENNPPKERRCG